jgi:hypothetical protein
LSELLKTLRSELEIADLFRRLGYLTRSHIDIYPYDMVRKVSDIDVFGIRFDGQLTPSRIVAEVKRKECSTTDILKLHGLAAYLTRCEGYFVTGISNPQCRKVAKELNIKLATKAKLSQIMGPAPKGFIQSDPQKIAKTYDYLTLLKKRANKEIFWKYHYLWLEKDPCFRLYQQQDLFDDVSKYLRNSELSEATQWFRREIFLLSQISVLEIASECVGISDSSIEAYLEDRFSNLGTPRKSKERIKSGVERLVNLISNLSGEQFDVPNVEILPRYISTLSILVKFIQSSTRYAQQYLLRNNELSMLLLEGKEADLAKIVSPKQIEFIGKFNDLLGRVLHNGPIEDDFSPFL